MSKITYTRKYMKARKIAPRFPLTTNDDLYHHLFEQGYIWDSSQKEWVKAQSVDNNPPSNLIRVRVMTGSDRVRAVADRIIELLEADGFTLFVSAGVYPCRPPKTNDGRVYLTFDPPPRSAVQGPDLDRNDPRDRPTPKPT